MIEKNRNPKSRTISQSPPPCGEADKIRSAAKNFSGGGTALDNPPPTRKSCAFSTSPQGGGDGGGETGTAAEIVALLEKRNG
jgi:hypothetical protein